MAGTATVLRGDARHIPLADASVDLIVTSPPYFSQRSYTDGGQHYDGQIGAEATPAEYIAALIACTREWMRVLQPTGSLFINLGDKYAARYASVRREGRRGLGDDDDVRGRSGQNRTGAPEKSLLLLPERYRIACADDLGLIARAVIVWDKPNPMPESVTDRVRRSHEDWVHLVKQPRYYSAVDYLREEPSGYSRRDGARRETPPGQRRRGMADTCNPLGKLPGSVWEIATEPLDVPDHLGVDHHAAFPLELPRRLILGWSPSGICTACGEGRRPVVDRTRVKAAGLDAIRGSNDGSIIAMSGGKLFANRAETTTRILGESCACPDVSAPTRPAVVLDPFGGTGTTALAAKALGRHGVTVDMSADYCRIAQWRTTDPAQLAKALRVEPPPKQADGQLDLLSGVA